MSRAMGRLFVGGVFTTWTVVIFRDSEADFKSVDFEDDFLSKPRFCSTSFITAQENPSRALIGQKTMFYQSI